MKANKQAIWLMMAVATIAFGKEAQSCRGSPKPPTLSTKNPNIKPETDPSKCGDRCLAVQPVLLKMVEKNQEKIGGLIRVTSGWRSCAQNIGNRGARNSDHLHGRAIDSNWGEGTSRCKEYRNKAMAIHGRTFVRCAHGTAAHLHMTSGGAPCRNCDKPTSYKRTTPSLERNKARGPRKTRSAPRYKREGARWADKVFNQLNSYQRF